jgi:uncharacterized protein (TIGR00251 family)
MGATVRIRVLVQPRAATSEAAGMHDGCWKIRVAAPPVDGAANEALIEFLAKRLGIAKSRVWVAAGAGARRKLVEIEGVALAAVEAALR